MGNLKLISFEMPTNGYIYVGHAQGTFDTGRTINQIDKSIPERRPYFNMYVLCAASSHKTESYEASGFKTEKLKCLSADVWQGLSPGDAIDVLFDSRQRVRKVIPLK